MDAVADAAVADLAAMEIDPQDGSSADAGGVAHQNYASASSSNAPVSSEASSQATHWPSNGPRMHHCLLHSCCIATLTRTIVKSLTRARPLPVQVPRHQNRCVPSC